MDRLEAMSLLVAVVETGSLSAASRKLGAPLPTVSRKISELEAHLRTRLLIRSTRKLRADRCRRSLCGRGQAHIREVREAERAAAGEYRRAKGDLVITAPSCLAGCMSCRSSPSFLAAVSRYRRPAVPVRSQLHLIDDHMDLAVRIGALADSALVTTRVGTVRNVVCGGPAYFAAHGVPKRPEDLSKLTAVTFNLFSSSPHWISPDRNSKRELSVQVRSRLAVNTAEAAIDGAAAGLGVTRVMSYQAAQAVLDGRVQIVLSEYEPEPAPVSLIHRRQGLTPLKVRLFLDFAARRLRARLAAPDGGFVTSSAISMT